MKGVDIQRRIMLGSLVLTFLLTLLASRLVYLQIHQYEKYVEIVRNEHRQKLVLPARRGSLYDRNGELLAADRPVRDVVADRLHLSNLDFAERALAFAEGVEVKDIQNAYSSEATKRKYLELVSHRLSRPLGQHPWEILEKLSKSRGGDVFLAPRFSETKALELEKILEEQKIRGIYCRRAMSRFYAYDARLNHVVGFVNSKNDGVEGAERSFEKNLAGVAGYREIEFVRGGVEVPAFRGESQPPKHGDSVYLSIDMRIQEVAESLIEKAWINYSAEKAMVIVTRPKTGEVLAMASRPHFTRSSGETGQRRNLAVSDLYEPGSTFKMVTFSGIFDHHLVSPSTPVFCHNGYLEGNGLPSPLRDHHPYGTLSVTRVFAKSSNIGTYLLARQLGSERLSDFVSRFGFGQKTGLALTGEASGTTRPTEQWSGTSLSRVAIGYEVAVTPIQMVMALGAIANGGLLLEPQMAHRITDHRDQLVSGFEPVEVRRIMEERTAKWMRAAMSEAVAEGGTGTKGAIGGVSTAGKTGTARKYFSKIPGTGGGGYGKGRYVTSFAGFFPVEDPEIAILVVIDDPQNEVDERYGGTVAAPVFAEIGGQICDVIGIRRTLLSTSGEGSP